MKQKHLTIPCVTLIFALSALLLNAQNRDYTSPATKRTATDVGSTDHTTSSASQTRVAVANVKASSLIGQSLRSSNGEQLGTVKDVLVNLRTQSAPYAIVEANTPTGGNAPRIAVPLSELRWSQSDRQLSLNGTKTQFDAANASPTGAWPVLIGPDWSSTVDRFYGQPASGLMSRYEREEINGNQMGYEAVRHSSEQKGAIDLTTQPQSSPPGAMRSPNTITDQALMTRINGVVDQTQAGQPGNVQVSLRNGVVTLSGSVPNQAQRQQLGNQIRALSGVDRVENHLIVENQ